MATEYDPDSLPFTSALSNIPKNTPKYVALADISQSVDMAKRILLQHKVRNFTATDVVRLAELIHLQHTQFIAELNDDGGNV